MYFRLSVRLPSSKYWTEDTYHRRGAAKGEKETAMERYIYGKHVAEVTDANGVQGFLLRSIDGSFFFRVYSENKDFIDYEILHNDLEVTITPDALAAFYKFKDRMILDHSPQVLGLAKAKNDIQD